jgi:hypothetical protein
MSNVQGQALNKREEKIKKEITWPRKKKQKRYIRGEGKKKETPSFKVTRAVPAEPLVSSFHWNGLGRRPRG